jgi:very-short-patch-repair endonuclease
MARRRGVTLWKGDRARAFRKCPAASEACAWNILRDRGVLGLKFRRQHVIDGYVVDFFCVEHRLVLEIDGHISIRFNGNGTRSVLHTCGIEDTTFCGFKTVMSTNRV